MRKRTAAVCLSCTQEHSISNYSQLGRLCVLENKDKQQRQQQQCAQARTREHTHTHTHHTTPHHITSHHTHTHTHTTHTHTHTHTRVRARARARAHTHTHTHSHTHTQTNKQTHTDRPPAWASHRIFRRLVCQQFSCPQCAWCQLRNDFKQPKPDASLHAWMLAMCVRFKWAKDQSTCRGSRCAQSRFIISLY